MEQLFVVLVVLGIYFLPAIIAASRHHRSADAIGILNLLLGWTVLGWVIALIWSATGDVEEPSAHRTKCPDCAELVLAEARVCKHCGCRLAPLSAAPTSSGPGVLSQLKENAKAEWREFRGKPPPEVK